jgi:hypothetical protein
MEWPEWLNALNLGRAWSAVKTVAAIVGFGTIIAAVRWAYKKLQHRLVFKHYNVPRKTLTIAPPTHSFWQMATSPDRNNAQMMLVRLDCEITNFTNEKIRIVVAYLKNPKAQGSVLLRPYVPGQDAHGNVCITPRSTVPSTITFMIEPPTKEEGTNFKSRFCLVDQFLNEHWHEKVEFKGV